MARGTALKKILEAQKAHTPEGCLPDNLGDGYLMEKNSVFKNIREVALALGVNFLKDDFCEYAVMPLFALPEILGKKKIPYWNNVSVLERLENHAPDFFHLEELPDFRFNYILHESSHIIANSLFPASPVDTAEVRKTILNTLLAESFANAVDKVSCFFVDSNIHTALQRANSYQKISPDGHEKKVMRQAARIVGFKNMFLLLWTSYLFTNFHREIDTKNASILVSVICPDISLGKQELKKLAPLFKLGKELNKTFIEVTAKAFFRILGFKEPLKKLLEFNFFSVAFGDPDVRAKMELLAAAVHDGLNAPSVREWINSREKIRDAA